MHHLRPVPVPPLPRWAMTHFRRRAANTQTVVIIVLSVLGGLLLLACVVAIALIVPVYQQAGKGARQAALRAQGQNNLRQIGMALHNYHDVYRQFPPGGIYGEDGTDYHSWQTMILPHMYGRHGHTGQRPRNEIGYHALRTGDNVGEHTIVFGMMGETLEISVRGHTRDSYAHGALAAAKFLVTERAGLYTMADVLGL